MDDLQYQKASEYEAVGAYAQVLNLVING